MHFANRQKVLPLNVSGWGHLTSAPLQVVEVEGTREGVPHLFVNGIHMQMSTDSKHSIKKMPNVKVNNLLMSSFFSLFLFLQVRILKKKIIPNRTKGLSYACLKSWIIEAVIRYTKSKPQYHLIFM